MEIKIHNSAATDFVKDPAMLQRNYEQIGVISERQEKRANVQKTRAQNLSVCFLFYQLLVFFSVSGSSKNSLRCGQWWIPFSMSALPAVLFFMTFSDATVSYYRTMRQLDMNYIEQQMIRKQIYEAKNKLNHDQDRYSYVLKPDGFLLFKRLLFIWTTVGSLVAFTAVVLFSCRFLLCN